MITKEQLIEVQNEWGAGVVQIGALKDERMACEDFTSSFLDKLYGFHLGEVLFKPTKCEIEQFRSSKEMATSYFIAGEGRSCSEDAGFAINPWTKVRFENSGFILKESQALAMGNYYFTDPSGAETKVEYTFGYLLHEGKLHINVHHSSLPYAH